MTVIARSLLTTTFVLLAVRAGALTCTSTDCPDEGMVDAVRGVVAAACDCEGASNHRQYVRCAKGLVQAAVRDATLPKACRKSVLRCEAATTCGLRNAMVCCMLRQGRGVKARIMKASARCPGTACSGGRSVADACTFRGTCTPPRRSLKTFRSVQQVFQTSCALSTCHSTVAREGGLVLDSEDVSYASLVERTSTHPEAQQQGLLRVTPGDAKASYLVRKLRGQGPGDSMPQAGRLLPEPVIQMVESWIARGARTTAEECGGRQCDEGPLDTGDYVWQPEPPLDVPQSGTGVQLYAPPRDVPAGTEWETCYAFRPNWAQLGAAVGLPAGQLPVIKQQVYRMHQGSHHLLLYMYFGQHADRWPEGYFPCQAANCINPDDCPPDAGDFTIPVGGTQVAGTRYVVNYPAGVGIPVLGPNAVLIANEHYTNPFQPAQPIYGEAWLNLYFQAPGEFKALLDGIFAINSRDLIVEPYETRTISATWQPRNILSGVPVDAAIFQLFGHMHKRGTAFQVDYVRGGACSASGAACGRDDDCRCKPWQNRCQSGQTCLRVPGAEDSTIYHTTEWDHAPVIDYTKPYLLVNREDGLRWTCTHTNGRRDDPTYPPKRCHEGCEACGWDAATRTCVFTRGVNLRVDSAPRVYQDGDPMPLVFGLLADDDMCNMFGYFINQAALPLLE